MKLGGRIRNELMKNTINFVKALYKGIDPGIYI